MRKGLIIAVALASSIFAGVAFAERAVVTTGTADKQKTEWEANQKEKVQTQTKAKVQNGNIAQAEVTAETTTENTRQENWMSKKNEIRANAEKSKEAFKLKKEKMTADRCAKVQERIQSKEGNLEQVKEKHMSVYTNLVTRVQKFIDRFKAAGLSTVGIEADLVTLNEKISEFKVAYANYAAKASESKLSACSETEGDFRGKLVDARAELKITHELAADIRNFVRTVILVDLRDLKAQMPQSEVEAEEEAESAENEEVETEEESETVTENETPAETAETVTVN